MIRFQDGQSKLDLSNEIQNKTFQEITSTTSMTVKEARGFWDGIFGKPRESREAVGEELFSEIYGREEEELSFDVDVLTDEIRGAMEPFQESVWTDLAEEEQIHTIKDLEKAIGSMLGISELPEISFYEAGVMDCGGYEPQSNRIVINRENMDDPADIVDTVAHELRHAYQYEHAHNPQNHEDLLYACNFENYISPVNTDVGYMNYLDYQDQYIEAEARAFAGLFAV